MDLLATVIWIFLSSTHDPVIMATAVVTVHSDPQSWQFRIQRRHRSLACEFISVLMMNFIKNHGVLVTVTDQITLLLRASRVARSSLLVARGGSSVMLALGTCVVPPGAVVHD